MTDTTAALDETDRRLVEFVQGFQRQHGYGPTYEEVGEHLDMTKQAADWRIRRLIDASLLSRQPNRPRTLNVMQPTITKGDRP